MSNSVPPLPRDLVDLLDTERSSGEMPNSSRDRLRGRLGLPDANSNRTAIVEQNFSAREAPTLRRPRAPKIRSVSEIIVISSLTFAIGAGVGGAIVTMFQSRALQQSSELGVERAMLEEGRRALLRKDVKAALTSVALHEREFALGQLTEEREALRIRALLEGKRWDEARPLLAAFEKRYPASLFTLGMRQTLENAGRLSAGGR